MFCILGPNSGRMQKMKPEISHLKEELTMGKKRSEPTVAQMELDLKNLKKKIEAAKQKEIFSPFLQLIIEASKSGKLLQLEEACKRVVHGNAVVKDSPTTSFGYFGWKL